MGRIKLLIGELTLLLFVVLVPKSCAIGLENFVEVNHEFSGMAGIVLGVFMLMATCVGVITRDEKSFGGVVAGVFYMVGSALGLYYSGSFLLLKVISFISLVFGVAFIILTIKQLKQKERT